MESNMTTDTRNLPEFTSVSLEGHGNLILVHGSTPSIIIETDPETLEHLKVEVENGRLILGMKSWLDRLFRSWKKVNYTVTYTALEAVSVSGSGKVQADELLSDHFKFHLSGSGSFATKQLTTADLEIHISGSADIELAGMAQSTEIRISGSGKVVAGDLVCQTSDVRISGSGNLTLNVTEKLDVSISGSGTVRYLGSPAISQSISGSGSVKQIE
jgi:hypothetical protein